MMLKDMEIREASEDDLLNLLKLQSQLTQSDLELALPAFKKIQNYPNYKIYLARIGDTVVGTFALLIMDNLGHMCSPLGIIENVVVDENLRGRGVGKFMMNFAKKGFNKQGYAYSLDLTDINTPIKLEEKPYEISNSY